MEVISRTSPRVAPGLLARLVAVFYLILLATGFDNFHVLPSLVVRGDAVRTAANILAHQPMFLAGFAAATLGVAAYVVVTALFYRLYEPVNRTLSLSAALFSLTGCMIQAAGLVFRLAPVFVLDPSSGGSAYLGTFQPSQLQALALLFLRFYSRAYDISLVFFGFYLVQIGYLTARSSFLPRWLGVLVAVLGAGWLVFLYPPLAHALSYAVILSSIGEIVLVLWLGIKAVDEAAWHDQAALGRG